MPSPGAASGLAEGSVVRAAPSAGASASGPGNSTSVVAGSGGPSGRVTEAPPSTVAPSDGAASAVVGSNFLKASCARLAPSTSPDLKQASNTRVSSSRFWGTTASLQELRLT